MFFLFDRQNGFKLLVEPRMPFDSFEDAVGLAVWAGPSGSGARL